MKSMIFPLLISLIGNLAYSQTSLMEARRTQILSALNSKPENWIEPITADAVELGNYEGRVVVNKKSKFTYFVHIDNALDANSPMTLIPMSTSRYTPTYYQTDEWWEKNKEEIARAKRDGRPQPKQDMEEVRVWLESMKFSTNPDVFFVSPGSNPVIKTESLQNYLLRIYLQNFVEDGKVVLYRGAEKPGELESWKKGEVPRGVRYWTPTANYAWRYARKNTDFLNLLLNDEAPLFRFEIPVEDFKAMINRKWPRLVLGTELTKNAHQIFDRSRYFGDHLYSGMPFLGWGPVGVELEVRSNRTGAQDMVRYFKRAASIDDLVQDRIRVLSAALKRLSLQQPEHASQYEAQFRQRIEVAKAEGVILKSVKVGERLSVIEDMLRQIDSKQSELGQIDGVNFRAWVVSKVQEFEAQSCRRFFK